VYKYRWQEADVIDVYSDTDWAGCLRTRKSTSGGCLMLGQHLLKSWSSTQTAVSLSSGEAEFYGVVKASGIGLGYQALLEDLGYVLPIRVWTDSSATMGICARVGLGKLRHIDTNCLWIQAKVRSGAILLHKVKGEVNPADLFTKHLSSNDRIVSLLRLFGCEYATGRSELAPKLRDGTGDDPGEILAVQEGWFKAEDLIEANGHKYPRTYDDYLGQWVADAYQHDEHRLPHTYVDPERLFPRAKAVEVVKEDEDLEPDDLERRGLELGKAKTTKTEAVATTLCMALYPSAYDAHGTLPLCASTTKPATTTAATTKTATTTAATTYNNWDTSLGEEVENKKLKTDALTVGLRGPLLIPADDWLKHGIRNDPQAWGPGVGCGGKPPSGMDFCN
jgi:hypothetical protein